MLDGRLRLCPLRYAEGNGRGMEVGKFRPGCGRTQGTLLFGKTRRAWGSTWLALSPRWQVLGWVVSTPVPLQGGRVRSPPSWRWGGLEGVWSSSAAELGRQASPEDDGSPVKSPGRAAPKLSFLYAFENRVNRLLTSTSIKEARQEALGVFSKNESSIPWTSARTRKRSTGTEESHYLTSALKDRFWVRGRCQFVSSFDCSVLWAPKLISNLISKNKAHQDAIPLINKTLLFPDAFRSVTHQSRHQMLNVGRGDCTSRAGWERPSLQAPLWSWNSSR